MSAIFLFIPLLDIMLIETGTTATSHAVFEA